LDGETKPNIFVKHQAKPQSCLKKYSIDKGLENFTPSKIFGVADFRDDNNLAYIQKPCRDVPWNVSTFQNHTSIQQCRAIYSK
jgi:hypothetical protein